MSEVSIRIKPHHFIDIITTFGAGTLKFEPHPYGHDVHRIARIVMDDPETELVMELGADDICAPCEHNIDGVCDDTIDTSYRPTAPTSKREWNLMIDRRWAARLGIGQDDVLTARAFCELLLEQAGDITDIYREIPAKMTRERSRKLMKGIKKYLGMQ